MALTDTTVKNAKPAEKPFKLSDERGMFLLVTRLLLTVILLLGCPAAFAAQSYDNCTGVISSLPTIIAASGTWCVKQNLSMAATSGSAITVNASNVTLDCNGFKLDGSAAGATTQATGIYATDRINVTVRHCVIRGFEYGVSMTGANGTYLFEDNRVDGSTYVGLYMGGFGSVARRNRVLNTGGTSLTGPSNAYGILAGNSGDFTDNTISGVSARSGSNQDAYGIFTQSYSGSVNRNRIRELHKDGSGAIYGIYNNSSGRIAMRDNDIIGDSSAGSYSLVCANANSRATDNVLVGFVKGILNCGYVGGGNILNP